MGLFSRWRGLFGLLLGDALPVDPGDEGGPLAGKGRVTRRSGHRVFSIYSSLPFFKPQNIPVADGVRRRIPNPGRQKVTRPVSTLPASLQHGLLVVSASESGSNASMAESPWGMVRVGMTIHFPVGAKGNGLLGSHDDVLVVGQDEHLRRGWRLASRGLRWRVHGLAAATTWRSQIHEQGLQAIACRHGHMPSPQWAPGAQRALSGWGSRGLFLRSPAAALRCCSFMFSNFHGATLAVLQAPGEASPGFFGGRGP